MVNLPIFIRMVREAQGIQQAELAKKIRVSQSAITQFEKLRSTLSVDTILRAAPILNMNPDFIQNGIGNPFKQSKPNKIIKLFLPEDPMGIIDFTLVEEIAGANKRATFFFLKPVSLNSAQFARLEESAKEDFRRWYKQIRQGISIFALFIGDEDGNNYLFKRKNNLLFGEQYLVSKLHDIEISKNRYFETEFITIFASDCQNIRTWSDIPEKDLIKKLFAAKHHRNRTFIQRLIGEIWTHKPLLTDRERYEKIKVIIEKMDDNKIDHLLTELIPDLAKVITARVPSVV